MDDDEFAASRARVEAARERNLIAAAEELGMDLSLRSEPGFVEEVRHRWMEANRGAMESWNAYVEKHGLPLDKYRNF
ncbi:hypothetical protein CP98_02420 [Sphingobium yanoikuyae]|uniref:Post-segregation antitoxin CcdA n=1 Tax=Sphingobium yanoikuyae TaxID=13690 RepID=A0A084EL67_SPHYA|nr:MULTISPECIES: type II toxin-antitoxin system CcdA family antitoxin [Sphingobium]KEZ18709.1 hypothetical protein CP98_02420 [Sphingobium yanoikuyae]PZU67970.1 MAG: hypothetical protein DI540_09720 [Sphingobium sp.]QJR02603.1 hypothetical protein HH800_10660 [Sphingobium yanoikuyae]